MLNWVNCKDVELKLPEKQLPVDLLFEGKDKVKMAIKFLLLSLSIKLIPITKNICWISGGFHLIASLKLLSSQPSIQLDMTNYLKSLFKMKMLQLSQQWLPLWEEDKEEMFCVDIITGWEIEFSNLLIFSTWRRFSVVQISVLGTCTSTEQAYSNELNNFRGEESFPFPQTNETYIK